MIKLKMKFTGLIFFSTLCSINWT